MVEVRHQDCATLREEVLWDETGSSHLIHVLVSGASDSKQYKKGGLKQSYIVSQFWRLAIQAKVLAGPIPSLRPGR